MLPESRRLVTDMREAASAIGEFVEGKSFSSLKDDVLRSAIYFKFVIVGEALSQLAKQDPEVVSRISDVPRIIGFRNQIIHGYAKIDDEITWRIIETKVPVLIHELDQLLSE
ncbi:MAG: hypothetical protein QOF78_4502 [Phycisphaerales bacterium]|jgi:uncharacterized protein with HEPN domain|nr:hypothetical protein [Phycisphaerales bacterium]